MKKLLTLLAIVLTVQCMAQRNAGVKSFYDLEDIAKEVNTSHLKVGTIVLTDSGMVRNATFKEELIFLIEDWIKHCKNDSVEIGIRYYYKGGVCRDVLYPQHRVSGPYSHKREYIYKSKDPNDIVGLLKWLKDN